MPRQNVVAPRLEVRRDLLPSVWPGDGEGAAQDAIASAELEVDADHHVTLAVRTAAAHQ